MDYKLLLCEECENVVSCEDIDEPTFICPVCGTINERDRTKFYKGSLTIFSPEMKCKIGTDEDEGIIGLADADEDLLSALTTLTKHGWSMRFKGERSDSLDEDDLED
jgi:hypothetical protein